MRIDRPIAALCLLIPAQIAFAASVQSEFREVWQSRLEKYQKDFDTARKGVELATRELISAVENSQPDAKQKLQNLYDVTNAAGYASGRAAVMQSLLNLMLKKPSLSRATLWIEDEISTTEALKVEADEAFKVVDESRGSAGKLDAKTELDNRMKAVFMAGQLRGRSTELKSLDENLAAFYEAKSQQDQERREKWAKILGGIANSTSGGSDRVSGGSSITTCNTIGNTTTCM